MKIRRKKLEFEMKRKRLRVRMRIDRVKLRREFPLSTALELEPELESRNGAGMF